MSDWFSKLLGFAERTHDQVRDGLVKDGTRLTSKVNGASIECGRLEMAPLSEVDSKLREMPEAELDALRAKLRIGVQWDTQVTLGGCEHLVTQAYCSALPVAYSGLPTSLWERFARLVLEAAYEATLAAAVLNAANTGNQKVFLTLLGGGAFGNDEEWIISAIDRSLTLYRAYDLDVHIVSFRRSNRGVQQLVKAFS